MFYWVAILFSQTLGTALGDWMADTKTGSATRRCGRLRRGLAVVTGGIFYMKNLTYLLFWAAFILTRRWCKRLGGTCWTNRHAHGGLEISRYVASSILAGCIIVSSSILPNGRVRIPGAHEHKT